MPPKQEALNPTAETLPMPLTEMGSEADMAYAPPVLKVVPAPVPPPVAPPVPTVAAPPTEAPTATPVVDHEAVKDERQLRHWVIRVFVTVTAVLFVAVVLVMLYVFVVRGDKIDGGIIGSFLETITEVLKLMKSPSPSP